MSEYVFALAGPEQVSTYWQRFDLPSNVPTEAVDRAIQFPGTAVGLWGSTTLSYTPIAGELPAEYRDRR